MDFHTLARRDLQFLCKKNRIPANITNVAMANALQALETVEGVEEIREALGIQSPKKTEASSPETSRAGRRSSAVRATPENEPKIQRKEIMEDNSKEEEVEDKRNQKEAPMDFSKTPAGELTLRKTVKGSEAPSTRREDQVPTSAVTRRRSVISDEAKEGKAVGVKTRRSTRLSSRKQMEVKGMAVLSRSRAKGAIKMAALAVEDSEEQEKLEGNKDFAVDGDSNVVQTEEDEKNNEEEERQGSLSSLDRKNSCVEVLGSPVEEDHGDDSKGEEKCSIIGLVFSGEIRSPEEKDAENGPQSDSAMKESIILVESSGTSVISADAKILKVADGEISPSLHYEEIISSDVSGWLDEEKETKISRLFTMLILDEAHKSNEEERYCSDSVAAGIPKEPEKSDTSPQPAIHAGVPENSIFASEVSIAEAEFFNEDPVTEKDEAIDGEIPKEPEESLASRSPAMVAGESAKEEHCCSDQITAGIPGELEESVTSSLLVIDAGVPQEAIFSSEISNAEAELVDGAPVTEEDNCRSDATDSEIPNESEESVTALSPPMVAGESSKALNEEEDCCSNAIAAGITKKLEESVTFSPTAIDARVPQEAIFASEISNAVAETVNKARVTENEDCCSDIIDADIPKKFEESVTAPSPVMVAGESAEELKNEEDSCSDPIPAGIPKELEKSVVMQPPAIDAGVTQDIVVDSDISKAAAEFGEEEDTIVADITKETDESDAVLLPAIVAGESTEELNEDEDCSSDSIAAGISKELEESVTMTPPAIDTGVPQDVIVDSGISNVDEAAVTEKDDYCSDTNAVEIPKETKESITSPQSAVVIEVSANTPPEPQVHQDVSFHSNIPRASAESVCETPISKEDDCYLNSIAAIPPSMEILQDAQNDHRNPDSVIEDSVIEDLQEGSEAAITNETTQEAKGETAAIARISSGAEENLLKEVNLEDLSMRKLKATYKKKLNDHNKFLGKISSKPKLGEPDFPSWSSKFKQMMNDSSNKSERKRSALKDLN